MTHGDEEKSRAQDAAVKPAAAPKPLKPSKLTAPKIALLRKPDATNEGGYCRDEKEADLEPSTASTISTVRADLWHTLRVLSEGFGGAFQRAS